VYRHRECCQRQDVSAVGVKHSENTQCSNMKPSPHPLPWKVRRTSAVGLWMQTAVYDTIPPTRCTKRTQNHSIPP
jgi:hypothetical protein